MPDPEALSELWDQVCKNIVKNKSNDQASKHIWKKVKSFDRVFEFDLRIQCTRKDQTDHIYKDRCDHCKLESEQVCISCICI